MLAAVLGFAAATGACPTGSSWCFRSKVPGVEYVTMMETEVFASVESYFKVQIAGMLSAETAVEQLQKQCVAYEGLSLEQRAEIKKELEPLLLDAKGIRFGYDKRAFEWADSCGATALDLSTLAPSVGCNATSKECDYGDEKRSTTCEFDAVEVIDCPGGGDDDDMALAIILSVVGVAVVALVVVAVVYKRNAGDRPAGSITGTLL